MKAFGRVSEYIWPQWPRVAVVITSAVVVSILLSLSFMTIIPLLAVMMDDEGGLHGWVDRKVCDWRYGVKFSMPEIEDFTQNNQRNYEVYLRVAEIEDKSIAKSAGLKPYDKIIAVSDDTNNVEIVSLSYAELLAKFANATKAGTVTLKVIGNGEEERIVKLNEELRGEEVGGIRSRIKTGIATKVKDKGINFSQWVMGFLPREEGEDNKTRAVVFIMVVMFVVTVIRCIAKYFQGYMAEKVVQVGLNRLREDAFSHAMNLPMSFFENERPSDTVSRLIRDTGDMGKGIKILLGKALREPMNAAFFVGGAMIFDWKLTLIFMIGGPPTVWMVSIFGKKMKKSARKSLMVWSEMLAKLQETMSGLKIVKVYNQQEYERLSFRAINEKLLKQLLKLSKVDAATMPVLEVLGMAAGAGAIIVGANWVTQQKMDGKEFLTMLIMLGAAAEAIRKTSDTWNKIQEANAASERVFGIIDQPTELDQGEVRELKPLRDKIEFKDVYFRYPRSSNHILKGINLTVRAGQNVAVVGPNGSGKTTLLNLIPRFHDVERGSVSIDGLDIRECTLKSLRGQIGMVTQNVVTFNATIAANIGYGKAGATKEEIINAAKRAFAHEFIEPLPNGYDTVIGEQGVGLSGGQLQRIVIARAILKNPAILIFDEATSQVDADSEAKIHNAIEEMMRDRTSFVIAHRFSTIITADVIVVMDDGRIVAQGQHEELIKNCRLYRSLYETQLIAAK